MFCLKLKGKIRLLLKHLDIYVDGHVTTALQITTQIKNLLASPVTDLLTAIIPGNVDDIIRRQLICALDRAIEALSIADSCKGFTDINDKLKCFVEQLRIREPHLQDALLQKLASLLTSELDGGRLKQSLYDLYTQARYAADKA